MIETPRLRLREMGPMDHAALCRIFCDAETMAYYPAPFDEEKVAQWIKRNRERYRVFGFGLWAVCLKETGEMIGDCGLTMQRIHNVIRPEIGYHIRGDQQRKGYAAEAAAAVRDWTFGNTPFGVVYSYMKQANLPSVKTALSYGCKQVDAYTDEQGEAIVVCAMTREEWANRARFLP